MASRVTARAVSMPCPTGGWNARDALDAMDPKDAVVLDNWFPETDSIRLRRGYTGFCASGMGSGAVETLMEYVGSSAKFLAAANGEIWDISSGTASSLASGFANNRWQYVNFSTAGGRYVVMVNGADSARVFDGTVITTPAITVATSANFVNVAVFQTRLFFVENGTLKFWYLPTNSIAGAAAAYDLSALCKMGGTLTAVGTWTRDNGFGGADDLFCCVTSEGEVLIFSGTDPSSAATWALVGRFYMGKPIGRRCLVKFGAELVVICQDGVVPLSRVMAVDASVQESVALSTKIGSAFTLAARSYGALFGWQGLIYPRANMAVFNVPQSSTIAVQYVVNTITGSWCQFKAMNSACWGLYNGDLYFGAQSGGAVYKADSGVADNGVNIVGDFQTAFSYPGGRGQQKRFTMCRPIFSTDGDVMPSIGVKVDYQVGALDAPTTSTPNGALWGAAVWGNFVWGGAPAIQSNWIGVSGIGYAVSLRLGVATKTVTMRFNSYELVFERGGFI